jgi:flagellar protein FlaG
MSISIPPNTQSPVFTQVQPEAMPMKVLEKDPNEARPVVAAKQEAAQTTKQETTTAKDEEPTREQLQQATKKINDLMGLVDKRLSFSVDESTDQVVVKVIDQTSGKVLDQIPAKNIIDMLKALHTTVGHFVDKWA